MFQEVCYFCLSPLYDEIYLLKCGHQIHINCLDALVSKNVNFCGLCRKEIFSSDELDLRLKIISSRYLLLNNLSKTQKKFLSKEYRNLYTEISKSEFCDVEELMNEFYTNILFLF